jgi:L-ascorbate metabolism protein UlaG (beta-lactamase superfamily)
VLSFDTLNVYVAGDTENIPEMANLKNIHWAFLPCNLPYTMSPDMFVEAVKSFRPKVVYPYHYHYGKTDLPRLKELMKAVPGTELRIPFEL